MQTFLSLIGFLGCVIAASITIMKAIEAVWFFQEFRKEVSKTLADIEETLRNLKP